MFLLFSHNNFKIIGRETNEYILRVKVIANLYSTFILPISFYLFLIEPYYNKPSDKLGFTYINKTISFLQMGKVVVVVVPVPHSLPSL